MKSKFLFFAIITALIMAGTSLADLLPNGSFEDDTDLNGIPDSWQSWSAGPSSTDGYLEDQGDAYDGSDYIYQDTGTGDFRIFFTNDVDVTSDTDIYASVMVKKPSAGSPDISMSINFEFYETTGGSQPDGKPRVDDAGPTVLVTSAEWEEYSFIGHSGTSSIYLTPILEIKAGTAGILHFDDFIASYSSIERAPMASNPDPANGASGVNNLALSTLTWDNATVAEANAYLQTTVTDAIEVEVYFDTNQVLVEDRDTSAQIISRQALSTITTDDTGPIGSDVYYWVVESYAVDTDLGAAELLGGSVWIFDTANTLPIVDAGPSITMWIENGSTIASRKVTTTPDVTDDGLPGSGLIYRWECPGATNKAENPDGSATIGFNLAAPSGAYEATLFVKDSPGGTEVSDSMVINMTQYADQGTRLIAEYQLNEASATGAVDTSGGGHDGTLVNAVTVGDPGADADAVIPVTGTSYTLDPITDLEQHVEIDGSGYMSDPNIVTWAETALVDGITVSCWAKTTATDGTAGTDWAGIVAKDTLSWELIRNNDNIATFKVGANGEASTNSGLINTLPFDGQWHHFVGTYDRNKVKIYLDGMLAGETDSIGEQIGGGAANIKIGSTNNPDLDPADPPQNPETWYQEWFAGSIDQVRIHDVAIPQKPINGSPSVLSLYRAENGRDNCGGVYDAEDLDQDCYIGLGDVINMAIDWVTCTDIANPYCDQF